jgi:hypothetical protein
MDFAFAYILIAFVTLAVKVAFVLAAGVQHLRGVVRGQRCLAMIKERQRRNELH